MFEFRKKRKKKKVRQKNHVPKKKIYREARATQK